MTDLLAQLKDVRRSDDGWTARCFAHTDHHKSVSIHHRGGRWLIKCCHAGSSERGCGWEARSPNDKKPIGIYKSWIVAANVIPAEVTP